MRVLVTGSNGLVGSAIKEDSESSNHEFLFASRDGADLTKQSDVECLFNTVKPDAVIHTAAKVGGIEANRTMQEEFFYDNILINANVIRECVKHGVKKLFAFSSVCVFPDDLAMLEEEKIHSGPVYAANFAYGYAKRMVDVHIRAAKEQYGFKGWTSIIPGNIFGKQDMFSIEHGHIIPALIHKLYIAKERNTDFVVWGDGQSLREFIYVNDLSKILITLLDKEDIPDKIIVSGREEMPIKSVVSKLIEISEFKGKVVYDTSKPNGQRSRPSSKKVIDNLLPDFEYSSVDDGLKTSWNWFNENYPKVRTKYVN